MSRVDVYLVPNPSTTDIRLGLPSVGAPGQRNTTLVDILLGTDQGSAQTAEVIAGDETPFGPWLRRWYRNVDLISYAGNPGVWPDYTGNFNTTVGGGTAIPAVATVNGFSALEFTGSSAPLITQADAYPNSNPVTPPVSLTNGGKMTVACVIQCTHWGVGPNGYQAAVGQTYYGNQWALIIDVNGGVAGKLMFTFGDAGSVYAVSDGVVADGHPHVVIGVFDGNTIHLYIDGVEQLADTSNFSPPVIPPDIVVGTRYDCDDTDIGGTTYYSNLSNNASTLFVGRVVEVMMADTALSGSALALVTAYLSQYTQTPVTPVHAIFGNNVRHWFASESTYSSGVWQDLARQSDAQHGIFGMSSPSPATINGHRWYAFNGSTTGLVIRPSFTVTPSNAEVFHTAATVACVFQTSVVGYQTIVGQNFYVSAFWIYVDPSGYLNAAFTAFAGTAISNAPVNDGLPHVLVVTWDGGSGSGVVTMYLDGVAQTGTQTGATGIVTLGTSDDLNIGVVTTSNGNAGAYYWNGFLGEILIVDVAARSSQRAALTTYLTTWATSSGPTAYTRSIGETLTAVSDGVARLIAYRRNAIAESVSAPTDGLVRLIHFLRVESESIGAPADGVTRLVQFLRTVGETVTAPSDGLTRLLTYLRAIGDSIGAPTDTVAMIKGYARAIAESITAPSDALTRLMAYLRAPGESVAAPTDALARLLTYLRALGETVPAPTDGPSRLVAFLRAVGESVVAPTDGLTRLVAFRRAVGETIGTPTDSVARQMAFLRAVGETIGIPTDALTHILGYARAVGESITLPADALTRLVTYLRAISDMNVGAPTDSVVGVKNGGGSAYTKSIAESIGAPTDGLSRLVAYLRALAENVAAPTDADTRLGAFLRALAEAIAAPNDGVTRLTTVLRPVGESVVSPTDAVSRAVAYLRAVAENVVKASDGAARQDALLRSIGESVTTTDGVARLTTYLRVELESIGAPTDGVAKSVFRPRSLTESITKPSDALTTVVAHPRLVVETLAAVFDSVVMVPVFGFNVLGSPFVGYAQQVRAVSLGTQVAASASGVVQVKAVGTGGYQTKPVIIVRAR